MKPWSSELVCTAFLAGQLPELKGPKAVMLGRSNVGKSTLINALLGSRIAKVSSTPGKTRSINFYRVKEQPGVMDEFFLVDLPGYGYASRGAAERRSWWQLINAYFERESELAFALHLVDFRHGMLPNDLELTEWLDSLELARLVVFTKGDKVPKSRRRAQYEKFVQGSLDSIAPPEITEGKNDSAMERLRRTIADVFAEIRKLDLLDAKDR